MRLPRNVADKRVFCGTALVEFSTEEDALKVLKESLVYAGAKLELKPKYVCFENTSTFCSNSYASQSNDEPPGVSVISSI